MKMVIVAVVLGIFAALFIACEGGPSTPPHSSWKERNEYCYWFIVDPRGESNHMVGNSDTEPVFESTEAGFIVRAQNVRVNLGREREDYFRRSVVWAIDGDGYVRIQNRCEQNE